MTAEDWASGGVFVLGAKGMLGHELMSALRNRLACSSGGELFGYDLPELDICDGEAVRSVLGGHAAGVVINAAAYTDVDGCETNRELAEAVNGEAPGGVAAACAEVGAKMVHFGTDFVFDGRGRRPYLPNDPANPLSVYGRTKWAGEEAVRSAGGRSLVVRTSWLFGLHGRNFVEAILTKAEAGQPLSVVDDQIGAPTLAGDLAEAVVRLLDAAAEGTVHFTNGGSCSWYDFACEIVGCAGLDVTVSRTTSEALARPAHRPAYSVLDTSRYAELTDHTPRPWRDALRRYMDARLIPSRAAGLDDGVTRSSER